jgi:uncharacterized protein (TIGR02596 family)
LIELLAVIAIIGVLVTLSIPAYQRIAASLDMTNAGQVLVAQLESARLSALANNRTVEFRIYQIPDQDSPAPQYFRAMQAFLTKNDGSLTATGKVVYLPDTITLSANDSQSPLLTLVPDEIKTPDDDDPDLPGIGQNYRYITLRFRGNGALDPKPDLGNGPLWYVTICQKQLGEVTAAQPTNFITIRIDPANGRTITYRP